MGGMNLTSDLPWARLSKQNSIGPGAPERALLESQFPMLRDRNILRMQ